MLQGCIFIWNYHSFLLSLPASSDFKLPVTFNNSLLSGFMFCCIDGMSLYWFLEVFYGGILSFCEQEIWIHFFLGKMIASFKTNLCCSYCVSNAVTARSSWKYLKINQCHLAKSAWKLHCVLMILLKYLNIPIMNKNLEKNKNCREMQRCFCSVAGDYLFQSQTEVMLDQLWITGQKIMLRY